jgi:glutamyl/glutaminyl-tRNA synthetase
MTPRVRFAPSPTGFFHIGSARTALFNWLYARHTKGTFILRIEDTDTARNSKEFESLIFDSLKWLGLNWDEGPDVGGTHGPYRQSERSHIYIEYLDKLLAQGDAYVENGFTFFKLKGVRTVQNDFHQNRDRVFVNAAPTVFEDTLAGTVSRQEDQDFVLRKPDGGFTFHFTNVVDDITMQITHVIRGADHLSNTSKHVELFKAFCYPVPKYTHIPLILNPDGKKKLSKREKGALILDYQKQGFLPTALVSFLALLGWSPGTNQEKFTADELINLFDETKLNSSNARFDFDKLIHINSLFVRDLTLEEYTKLVSSFIPFDLTTPFAQKVLSLARSKVTDLSKLGEQVTCMLNPDYPFLADSRKALKITTSLHTLHTEFCAFSESLPTNVGHDQAVELLKAFATAHDRKPSEYIHSGRYFLTGQHIGLGFYDILTLLDPNERKRRLERAKITIA